MPATAGAGGLCTAMQRQPRLPAGNRKEVDVCGQVVLLCLPLLPVAAVAHAGSLAGVNGSGRLVHPFVRHAPPGLATALMRVLLPAGDFVLCRDGCNTGEHEG